MGIAEGIVEVQKEKKGSVLVLRLKGRLDAITSSSTEKKIFDLIDSDSNKLLLDFNGVDYLSSAGMRILLSTTKKLKAEGGRLRLCCITNNVMDVLKMSGFDHVLDLYDTETEALKGF